MEPDIPFTPFGDRPKFTRGSPLYQNQIQKLHQGANARNPRTYCASHHSIETRTTRDYIIHKDCLKLTPANYAGKTFEETETKFFDLCLKRKLA